MIALPEGWRVAYPEDKNGYCGLEWPDHGFVTINYKLRGYSLGLAARLPDSTGVYQGAGWRGRLEQDAITALQKIYEEENEK